MKRNMKHRCYQSGYHGIIVRKIYDEEIFVISFDAYRVDGKYFGELHYILSIQLAKFQQTKQRECSNASNASCKKCAAPKKAIVKKM